MRAWLRRFSLPLWTFPLLLAGAAGLAYGLLFPWLGFYWDEWPMTWIAHKLGPDGLARYFATNRPYWGMIYRVTTQLLGAAPWHWQLFGLFWRWVSAAALWAALRQVWRGREDAPAFAALLFLLYPGFMQQSIAMMYGHFFVVLSAYLLSVWLNLLALRSGPTRPARFALLTLLAVLLGLVNLMAMEYFFLLELLRPLLILAALRDREGPGCPRRALLLAALKHWLPYLLMFLGAAAWRAFFFPYQTQNYQPGLLKDLLANPLGALLELITTAARDLLLVTFGAWGRALRLPDASALGLRTTLLYAGVTAALAALLAAGLLLRHTPGAERGRQPWAFAALGLGLAALLLAGPPFWLTRLPVTLDYPNDRFTLPFMLGFALFFTGLLGLLPGRRVFKVLLLAAALSLAGGLHFQQASAFRRDWNMHRALFWQMSWRIPALQPGTALLSSDLPLKYYSDNSLAGPLNWIYAPDNRSQAMGYMFYYASVRSDSKALLQPGRAINQDYLAARFNGSTSQMTALVFHPPACLRVLDPDLDPLNGMLPELMRQGAQLSRKSWILPAASRAPDLTPAIFGSEPPRGWCYYFEQAELAAQQKDWQTVVELGNTAFSLDDYPNDPMERVVFIEGYAHNGNWQRAAELTREARAITPLMQPVLCRLWQRIEAQSPPSPERDSYKTEMDAALGCAP